MKTKVFCNITIKDFFIFSVLGWIGLNANLKAQTDTPNILYIFTDQQTASAMSCAGNPDLKTPNIDRLASRGIRFTNAYCAAPLPSPSRASMFTGYYPHQTGILKNGVPIPDEFINNTCGHLLAKAGYECVYGGKWHLPASTIDTAHGFKMIHKFGDNGLADSCITFLNQKHKKPFFLVVSFDNPHNICEYARKQPLPWTFINEPVSINDCPNLPLNAQYPVFQGCPAKIDFSNTLRDWDGFGFNYVETAQTIDYATDAKDYGGFSIMSPASTEEIIELVFRNEGLKPGLVKMFLDPFHQVAQGTAFDHESSTRKYGGIYMKPVLTGSFPGPGYKDHRSGSAAILIRDAP